MRPAEPWTDVVVVSENDVLGDGDDEELVRREHVGGLAPARVIRQASKCGSRPVSKGGFTCS